MAMTVRPIEVKDEAVWRKHWHSYNEFYKRVDDITEEVTATTFSRFLDCKSPIQGAVAVDSNDSDSKSEQIVGFVTWYPHANTASVEEVIYLNDLFVAPESRNGGIGRKLIEHVYAEADRAGIKIVYW